MYVFWKRPSPLPIKLWHLIQNSKVLCVVRLILCRVLLTASKQHTNHAAPLRNWVLPAQQPAEWALRDRADFFTHVRGAYLSHLPRKLFCMQALLVTQVAIHYLVVTVLSSSEGRAFSSAAGLIMVNLFRNVTLISQHVNKYCRHSAL